MSFTKVATLISVLCLLLAFVNGLPAPKTAAKTAKTAEAVAEETSDLKTDESIGLGYGYPGYYGYHGLYHGYYPYYGHGGYYSHYSHYPYYGLGHHGQYYW